MEVVTAIVTAYCACVVCCGPHSKHGLTASGVKPKEGRTIAGPRWVRFGTVVEVKMKDGRKLRLVVEDRLAPQHEGRWDVFKGRHRDAKAWGKELAEVKILQRSR